MEIANTELHCLLIPPNLMHVDFYHNLWGFVSKLTISITGIRFGNLGYLTTLLYLKLGLCKPITNATTRHLAFLTSLKRLKFITC